MTRYKIRHRQSGRWLADQMFTSMTEANLYAFMHGFEDFEVVLVHV